MPNTRLAALVLLLLPCTLAHALDVPLVTVEPPSAEIRHAPHADNLHRFAAARPLAANPAVDGIWIEANGQRRWQLDVLAPRALSQSLFFDRFSLPAGASLTVSNADGSVVQGPYTSANGRKGRLWTGQVPGELAHVELLVPAGADYTLHLKSSYYGYAPLQAKSGSCNVDVVCPAGDDWQDQINSTVLLEYTTGGGNYLVACSGTLINNTALDMTPYILTADHCLIGENNDDSVNVYFRYQRDTCKQPRPTTDGRPDVNYSLNGTQWLADDYDQDFTLLVIGSLDSPQIPPADFIPVWSGWDRRGIAASSGAGVHHPTGHEKAISLFKTQLVGGTQDIEGRQVDAWQVLWNLGTTEQGSSGSGLFNPQGLLVGSLSGGEASCSAQDAPDYYSKFATSWDFGPNANNQLKAWLDPANTGATTLGSLDASGSISMPPVETTDSGAGSTGGLLFVLGLLGWRRRATRPSSARSTVRG